MNDRARPGKLADGRQVQHMIADSSVFQRRLVSPQLSAQPTRTVAAYQPVTKTVSFNPPDHRRSDARRKLNS
jgi:hypothetical protein